VTTQFHIEKRGGKITQESRPVFAEQVSALPDGWHKVTITESKPGAYTPTRYRYYFGVMLPAILEKCADRFLMIDQATAEQKTVRNTTDLHECLKVMYNPVTVITPRGAYTTGGTTTNLADRDFIGEYLETIYSDFSQPPYNVEFRDKDEWRAEMKGKKKSYDSIRF